MILVVASKKDTAGLNIATRILKHYTFKEETGKFQGNVTYAAEINGRTVKLITLNEECVYAQNLPDFFTGLELVIFISRHSSESGTPTLSVHTPGNLGEAQLGGMPRTVSISPANTMRDTLKAIAKLKGEMRLDYEVSYEGTHHGPSLNVPTMFAELGSSRKQWSDLKAAEAVAHAAMDALSKYGSSTVKTVLGIGGLHYNSKFTRMALENELAFGHMIPKYAIPTIDSGILKQCIERTSESVDSAVLDWKGIKGEDKQPLVKMLMEAGISFEKV
jgi:D-aminoacyl-tRNA deacylase